ncbi:MAG: peptide ABC transporter substrate-binding protein [Dehalococcoidia bacterium]
MRARASAIGWLLGALALVAAGWLAFAQPRDTAEARTYTEGVIGRIDRINPLFAERGTPDADLATLVFAGLTRPGRDGLPEPDLAERWEITPDALTYTFTLREGLFWHDGEPLTAQDVAFTVQAVQDEGFRGPADLAAAWTGVTTLVVDDRTVIFRLPARAASFLARAELGIVPRHLLEGLSPDELHEAAFNLRPVGSGPFRLDAVDATSARLSPNPSYYRGPPRLAGIELRTYLDEGALARALASGEIDATLLPDAPSLELSTAVAQRTDLQTSGWPLSGYDVLYLNTQRAPFEDVRVRNAVARALSPTMIEDDVYGGRGISSATPISPASWAWPQMGEPGTLGPKLAVASSLLEEAGWERAGQNVRVRDGTRLVVELATNPDPGREATARLIASQLAQAGIEVQVEVMPSAQLLGQRLEPRDFDMVLFGWDEGIDPDPYGAWHTSQLVPPGRNFSGITDPEIDALLEAARGTLDRLERTDLYGRFRVRFLELMPAVVLRFPSLDYVQPAALEVGEGRLLVTPAARLLDARDWRYVE